ncbi:MAG TPA: hypothetical protein VF629_03400 [Hymenobacter sp.]|jgi:hypothetical protein|uniref:hypothetical protein n=1 Tax=Hymenobacter sp. TaxID=1898978 RepID=UPI002EDAEBD2
MLLRLLFVLPAFFFCAFESRAQAYEPGLLVTSQGDTLRGELENGFWVEPPAFIRFRPAAGSPSQLFQPRQLRAVSFTGGRYFRYEALPIDYAAQTQLDKLARVLASDIKIDTLLAEVLVEGTGSLYRVARSSVVHYVVSSPGRPMLSLSEHKYLRENDNGVWAIADGNNYKALLGNHFSKCPASKMARTAPFTAEALVAIVQAYNRECAPGQQTGRDFLSSAKPRRRVALLGGVLAGVRYNRIVSGTANYYNNKAECTDCQALPYLGLYADLFQPSRTSALYGELSFSTFGSLTPLLVYTDGNLVPNQRNVESRHVLGTARIGYRFFFPLPQERKWLLGVGYELNSALGQTVVTSTGPTGPRTREKLVYADPTYFPNLSLGWRSNRLTLNLDGQMYYDEGNVSRTEYLSNFIGSNVALRLGVAYQLGRNPDAAKASK